ncbi:hypothetical protein A2631_03100 [Candidatus Daviesbacteria bacterium RIFCSPHIGHO2_01_FULL_44_29]|uniref:HTH marR-type domain-containing protein n=1 Tax=Candidatus Daviesbacteria bacterium RIFCSPHIGHO2_02_FULL_43_12 TaxID=1797776 RepID=A0A1F5KL77_9BACT|nr:MAG: hypothetical protein A2631_03100 [Candidatus Daviesbacteria bacterium RIFCSPHIGHO2_01_FULL_44_29]OGE40778.1 MAG: hypothetical protein A3E86_02245 [Candidatus Daviesbacteria bacterium RIFCSPHIGHO2_12_FULL_47_45]OGE41371.1 MAG: hypothetical protein A3D25_02495 [Candidatus Daviesbacteria bacterium RIFCSPHIGHO2_02_FULL_43_12]OGE69572.1 MAG: hypothetical protein A3B55_04240 [Candidatus Daviesbacteria bacterium RIFCSPLOWO2_01_FULL_43_15]
MTTAFNIENFITNLYKLSREFRRQPHLEEDYLNISPLQLHTLVFIKESSQPSMSQVSSYLGVALPTATKLIERLVDQNILERMADPGDRRITKIALTEKGREVLQLFKRKKIAQLKVVLALLSEEEQKTLYNLTLKMLAGVEKPK